MPLARTCAKISFGISQADIAIKNYLKREEDEENKKNAVDSQVKGRGQNNANANNVHVFSTSECYSLSFRLSINKKQPNLWVFTISGVGGGISLLAPNQNMKQQRYSW
ncbi:hypothetical protein QBC36DRAFT_315847 [Triangularia setosa]|uniref:Uncharacterized protein n=1 Tax=Triangularia setosa TaxID=2587417 RepID=A0AAN6VXY3_9PEZI|nr:hypothetical protein QBC36DRAFT_315847 [Podospora setosa]